MKKITASKFRSSVSGSWIRRNLTEPIALTSGKKHEPIAVVVPYQEFHRMQEVLNACENWEGGDHPDVIVDALAGFRQPLPS